MDNTNVDFLPLITDEAIDPTRTFSPTMKLSLQAIALGILSFSAATVIPDMYDAPSPSLEPRANEYCTQNPGKSGTFWLEWQEYVQSTVSIGLALYFCAEVSLRHIVSGTVVGNHKPIASTRCLG